MIYEKEIYIFLIICSTLILLSLFLLEFNSFVKNYELLQINTNIEIEKCLNSNAENDDYKKFCDELLNQTKHPIDFYTIFGNTFVYSFRNVSYFLFLFVSVPALLYISYYFKNRIIFTELTRKNYKDIKKSLFFHAYSSSLIIPFVAIIGILVCYMYTKTFDYSYAVYNSSSLWTVNTMKNSFLFIVLYILNIFFHSVLYINISLCVVRKYHNYFIALILSYLIFIATESILEIGFYGIIFTSLLKTDFGYIFNIMNFMRFNDFHNVVFPIIVPFILMILSFIVLHMMYRNKEKFLYDIEKNE